MILGTSCAVRVYAYREAVDLRKGYDGLFGLVKQGLGRDPLSGDLFLFVNGRRKGCKVLVWDGTGLCIFVVEDEAAAIPEENLHAIATPADEDEEVAGERIERERVLHERAEAIVSPPKIDRLGREEESE